VAIIASMTRIAGLVVATATVLLLAGCTAAPEPLVTATPITAQETCSQLGDVMTILHNARVSFAEGRSIRQEYDGAIRLASRVLARVPAEAGSKLGDSVNALKAIAPDRLIGSASTSFDPDSAAWGAARLDVALACTAAGSEIAVEGWTGG
jgi:hypothetical protein